MKQRILLSGSFVILVPAKYHLGSAIEVVLLY